MVGQQPNAQTRWHGKKCITCCELLYISYICRPSNTNVANGAGALFISRHDLNSFYILHPFFWHQTKDGSCLLIASSYLLSTATLNVMTYVKKAPTHTQTHLALPDIDMYMWRFPSLSWTSMSRTSKTFRATIFQHLSLPLLLEIFQGFSAWFRSTRTVSLRNAETAVLLPPLRSEDVNSAVELFGSNG